MKNMLRVVPLIAILLLAVTPAKADFTIGYPDGSLGLVWAIGGAGHAFVFADFAGTGDDDIFTSHTAHSSTPLFVNLGVGASTYIGYWLDFQFINASGFFVYDVYATQGGAFFYVGTYLL
jgi:hypothetical protein